MGNHAKRMRDGMAHTRRLMWQKRSLLLAMMAFWMTALLGLLWSLGVPEDWPKETVAVARLDEITESRMSRWGRRTHHYDVLVAEDGRVFRFSEGVEAPAGVIAGEVCTLVYEEASGGALYIRSLSTAEEGELVSWEESAQAHREKRRLMWLFLLLGEAALLGAFGLQEAFGMKTERMLLAKFQEELDKIKTRAGR